MALGGGVVNKRQRESRAPTDSALAEEASQHKHDECRRVPSVIFRRRRNPRDDVFGTCFAGAVMRCLE